MNQYIIYTDGSYNRETKIGAWAFLIFIDDQCFGKDFGYVEHVSDNNQIELIATLKALNRIPCKAKKSIIDLYTDSMYCLNIFNRKSCKDYQLRDELKTYLEYHHINIHHCMGHSIHEHNNTVNLMAQKALTKAHGILNIPLNAKRRTYIRKDKKSRPNKATREARKREVTARKTRKDLVEAEDNDIFLSSLDKIK